MDVNYILNNKYLKNTINNKKMNMFLLLKMYLIKLSSKYFLIWDNFIESQTIKTGWLRDSD